MRLRRSLVLLLVGTLSLSFTSVLPGSVQVIDSVQEDWVLIVSTPDFVAVGPQITTCMSPVSDDSQPFVAFDMNYREFPSFRAGGLQLQVWSGETVLSTSSQGTSQFATPGETVTWTQQMSLNSGAGTLTYNVNNGQSTTWGTFGQGSGANLSVSYPTTVTDLSGYSPATSQAASGATWESNHVTSMTLVQVRYYSGGQLVTTDSRTWSINLSGN